MRFRAVVLGASLVLACPLGAQTTESASHAHHHHRSDGDGMVMNENVDRLPRDCEAVSADVEVTVHAGRAYADGRHGAVFGMDRHEVRVPRCSRVTVTFVNEDEIRHQWMVHGLPAYLYPAGMFHIEVAGGRRQSGTFIVPGDDRTYLVHCDMAQHMEKGMRGQLVVGDGSGDLWGVPGISDAFYRGAYLPAAAPAWLLGAFLAALAVTLAWRRRA